MAKKFDIKSKYNFADILNDNSKSEAAELFTIQNIPIEKILPSADNKYGIRDIDELAANIEELGLLHNLVVNVKNECGYYTLISGERRWRACKQLFDSGNKKYAYLPCKVENTSSSHINELKLIYANAMSRELTDAEKVYQAGRIKSLLHSLRQEGHEFSGRMREIAAQILDVSITQMGIYEKIDRDLSEALKKEFKSENFGITTAYELSKLDKKEQAFAQEELKNTGTINIKAHKKQRTFSQNQSKEPQVIIKSLQFSETEKKLLWECIHIAAKENFCDTHLGRENAEKILKDLLGKLRYGEEDVKKCFAIYN